MANPVNPSSRSPSPEGFELIEAAIQKNDERYAALEKDLTEANATIRKQQEGLTKQEASQKALEQRITFMEAAKNKAEADIKRVVEETTTNVEARCQAAYDRVLKQAAADHQALKEQNAQLTQQVTVLQLSATQATKEKDGAIAEKNAAQQAQKTAEEGKAAAEGQLKALNDEKPIVKLERKTKAAEASVGTTQEGLNKWFQKNVDTWAEIRKYVNPDAFCLMRLIQKGKGRNPQLPGNYALEQFANRIQAAQNAETAAAQSVKKLEEELTAAQDGVAEEMTHIREEEERLRVEKEAAKKLADKIHLIAKGLQQLQRIKQSHQEDTQETEARRTIFINAAAAKANKLAADAKAKAEAEKPSTNGKRGSKDPEARNPLLSTADQAVTAVKEVAAGGMARWLLPPINSLATDLLPSNANSINGAPPRV